MDTVQGPTGWKGRNGVARNPDPLSNTGLTERLEQQSRRGGATLGVAMALCIAIGIAGFVYLYNRLDFFPDARTRATNPAAGGLLAGGSASAAVRLSPVGTRPAGTPGANATAIAGAAVATAAATAPAATPTPATPAASPSVSPVASATPAFSANYRIVGGQPIVFRAEAGTSSARLKSLPPGTELQYLGQTQELGADRWLRLRDSSSTEGWVREIDLEKLPG